MTDNTERDRKGVVQWIQVAFGFTPSPSTVNRITGILSDAVDRSFFENKMREAFKGVSERDPNPEAINLCVEVCCILTVLLKEEIVIDKNVRLFGFEVFRLRVASRKDPSDVRAEVVLRVSEMLLPQIMDRAFVTHQAPQKPERPERPKTPKTPETPQIG